MRRPVEHGNLISSIVLGISAIFNSIILDKNFYSVLYWIPIWAGLFIFDIPLKKILNENMNILMIFIIGVTAILSLFLFRLLVIPYAIFLIVYVTRIYFTRMRISFVSVILGLLGYVLLFSLTWLLPSYKFIIITSTLFLFMLGSEFAVRGLVSKKKVLSLYNLITFLFAIINPIYIFYSISIARIIAVYRVKKIKIMGIIESSLLILAVIFLEIFVIFKII